MTSEVRKNVERVYSHMRDFGEIVHTRKWQGQDISQNRSAQMVELLHYNFESQMPQCIEEMGREIGPNLPWADQHFQERVSGYPMNPGSAWKCWPWNSSTSLEGGIFNHNYMERYWPKFAGLSDHPTDTPASYRKGVEHSTQSHWQDPEFKMIGIRGEYGDLQDVVELLRAEPDTRQAYLPVWFPEDTGKLSGRKPCSLGYHFIMRNGKLDVVYYLRSCDLFRHFRDDVYLTCRLAKWILNRLREDGPSLWSRVQLGKIIIQITSLHMFVSDYMVTFKRSPDQ